jgi:hypothetical protein
MWELRQLMMLDEARGRAFYGCHLAEEVSQDL